MKKLVLIAVTVLGVGLASSRAGFAPAYGHGSPGHRPVAGDCIPRNGDHHVHYRDLVQEHNDLHRDVKRRHQDFLRAMKYDPTLRREYAQFEFDLKQELRAFHRAVGRDHEDFE